MSIPDDDFDQALIKGAFDLAAREGWPAVSVAGAAREAGVPLERARAEFPGRASLLLALGRMADRHALSDLMDTAAMGSGATRERLFDMLMRRFDVLQQHRAGVLALLRALPADPGETLLLASATAASMGWMLEAAEVSARGPIGALRVQGLVGVWLYALRAWRKDDTADLSGTMAALDRALQRAERVAGWFERTAAPAASPKPFPEPAGVPTVIPVIEASASPASSADQP